MVGLDTKLAPVVGKRTADVLRESFGYHTVRDLLRHYPRRLDDRGQLTDMAQLQLGEQVTILARIADARTIEFRTKNGRPQHRLELTLTDGRQRITATFFGQRWRASTLPPGTVAYFSGKVGDFRGTRQLTHPDVDVLDERDDVEASTRPDRFVPVFAASASITSWRVRAAITQVLAVVDHIPEHLPDDVLIERRLLTLDTAIRAVHAPEDRAIYERALERLRFDEAFLLQAVLLLRREAAQARPAVPRAPVAGGIRDRFEDLLPFTLTDGQIAVDAVLTFDLGEAHPMQRLLQGEVGSGKTVCALLAMLQVVDAGGQAVLLAPTEVLAQQHLRGIRMLLGPLAEAGMLGGTDVGTQVGLLTGSVTGAARRRLLAGVESGEVGIVIGTHALLEDAVHFRDLGLVVVDEQHRFGVEQRSALTDKGGINTPHVLVMTATPIPRTVAMTVFGDLDTTVLDELPVGRQPIQTTVVPAEQPSWLDRAWRRVREEVDAGHQAYVVCPRIGGDEPAEADGGDAPADLDAEDASRPSARQPLAVLDVLAMLEAGPLQGLRLAVLHGRLPPDEKDRVMRAFAAGQIDVLVATTVIEVGVDVPNATVMVLMDAERFGVSSLHQLRGRIGRGSAAGLCLLVTESAAGSASRERLDAVAATTDGFELANLDLATRREGDVLGAMQSGARSSLRVLSVIRDAELIAEARRSVEALLARDPGLREHRALAAEIERMFDDQQAQFLDKT